MHHFVLIWSASILTKTFENPGFFWAQSWEVLWGFQTQSLFLALYMFILGQSWPKWKCHTRQKFSSQCQHKFLWRKGISSFDTSASRLYLCFFWRIKRLEGTHLTFKKSIINYFPNFGHSKTSSKLLSGRGLWSHPVKITKSDSSHFFWAISAVLVNHRAGKTRNLSRTK